MEDCIMISLAALRPAVTAVIPHLPKAAGRVVSCSLPYLPLAIELGKVAYKHREKIGIVVGSAATHTAIGITGLAKAASCLPKKIDNKVGVGTRKLPFEVMQRSCKIFKKYQNTCCTSFVEKFKRKCIK